ncbi:three component ABC system middle component [Radiobacillus sp. PE A8.2]|uniref:three component ABC system middle component n=1 Tax=Radiobacillus sp. PE A8.2 TaxID=3380349 RepID=UPI00388DE34F
MGRLVQEVKIWNTPLIGAYLLWRFTQGYSNNHPKGEAPIAILHFIAIAILTNNRLLDAISNRREGLQSYIRSFEDNKDIDLLLSIHSKVGERKSYTLKAIDIAVGQGLLIWDPTSGRIYPCDLVKRASNGKALKNKIKREGDKAEILGKWFSKHDIPTITTYLKVVL